MRYRRRRRTRTRRSGWLRHLMVIAVALTLAKKNHRR